ncbi:hypothetical protein PENSTE_c029G05524 [Penicillium steckii]|uniref:FAD/NAD(P)-binding domain-containing protein n=1 Tax=Penicillium steckii TaxID=303698 RepID=A0A1V6SMG1_9EURO|nr:hypothetical protein PENSTE_c029G05524 [Penicillium steckii]
MYDFDVIIVGAGISGINFAYRLQERHPGLTYCILEDRHEIGGTWSLFQYPGIRSDSDLYTFGFAWRPWTGTNSIVSGSIIRDYIEESATQAGINKRIRFLHKVNRMNWSSSSKQWTFDITANSFEILTFRSRFVFLGTGYYDYQTPLHANIPGIQNFQGEVVHPQFWPADLDYKDKRVVIIGSGATAITLLPSLAIKAAHVTMLQRSPTYIASLPIEGTFETMALTFLPELLAAQLIRTKWICFSFIMALLCRTFPRLVKSFFLSQTAKLLPSGMNLEPDFVPLYDPWEQRLCLAPDGDFFTSMKSGKASVKTGHIQDISKNTIKLTCGKELQADIIVTATGLKICTAGGIKMSIEGKPYDITKKFSWRTAMVEDLPKHSSILDSGREIPTRRAPVSLIKGDICDEKWE